jgi:hypothetical protein
MLERLRKGRGVLLWIAMLVMVIRIGGLHAHADVPASLESAIGMQGHFNTSAFDAGDDHDHDHGYAHQEDSRHVDVETVGASDRHHPRAGFDLDLPLIFIGALALVLALPAPLSLRPPLRTLSRSSKPIHLRPLLRGPPAFP